MTLEKFIAGPDGKPKRGAISRVADHLRVAPGTVRRWLNGEWPIAKDRKKQIREMIRAKISLEPDYSRCGRKKKNVATVQTLP